MKDFTLFQEALALKELGFDEHCFGYYQENKDKIILDNSGFITNSNFTKIFSETRFRLVTPTYSQAFRFFREKYNLHVNKTGNANYTSFNMTEPKMEVLSFVRYTDTKNHYEEAELACLRKLIEIVKKK